MTIANMECAFYQQNKCRHGDKCRFVHTPKPIIPAGVSLKDGIKPSASSKRALSHVINEPLVYEQMKHGLTFIPFAPDDNVVIACDFEERRMLDPRCDESSRAVHCMNEDCAQLLRLPFAQFVAHLLYNQSLKNFLDSFLRYRSRAFDTPSGSDTAILSTVPSTAVSAFHQLSRRVLMVYLRLTGDEHETLASQSPPFSGLAERYGDLLYRHWIIDVPKILDLVALYGFGTHAKTAELLQKFLLKLTEHQPAYTDDLAATCIALMRIVGEIESKVVTQLSSLDDREAGDVLLYLRDIFMTCLLLTDLYPHACVGFLPTASPCSAVLGMATVHDIVLPALASRTGLGGVTEVREAVVKLLYNILSYSASSGAKAGLAGASGGQTLLYSALEALLEVEGSEPAKRQVVRRLSSSFDLRQLLLNAGVDDAHVTYVADILHSLGKPVDLEDSAVSLVSSGSGVAPALSEAVAQVKAIFPDIPNAFVLVALEHYGGDPIRLIEALVDDKLPPKLLQSRRELEGRGPVTKEEKSAILSSMLLDKDELAAGVVVAEAWTGKKDIEEDDDDFDPALKLKMIRAFSGYSDYDDEYDDSYDGVGVNVRDNVMSEDEAGVMPVRRNANHGKGRFTVGEELLVDEDEEEDALAIDEVKPVKAVRDGALAKASGRGGVVSGSGRGRPEATGEIAVAPAAAPAGRGAGPSRGRGRGGRGGRILGRDLTEEEKRDRARTSKNKASAANHSRKRGAAKKLAKGMI